MPLIEPELGKALNPAVKRKANKTRKLRDTAKRVSANATEVMVKITGFGKGGGHVKAHLDYITRNGKLEIENERGEVFNGKDEVKAFFKDWEKDFSDSKRHKNQRDTMHMVLSMPESVDPESVKNAVREFAQSTFAENHEYVFALHTDEPHPHCHITVKCLGFNGRRLNPRKDDLQDWREAFADKLRDQGVDAEATGRRSRGVVKKAEPSVIRHIERGDKTHQPRVSRVRAEKIKEAARELSSEAKGLPVAIKPWEAAISARQNEIRRAWLSAADAFDQSAGGGDKTMAGRIRGFVAAMPPVETERDQMKRDLAQRFAKKPEKILAVGAIGDKPGIPETKKGADKAAPREDGKDLER